MSDDPRYDAVGSSSLREELFNTFLKARGSSSSNNIVDKPWSSEPLDDGRQDKRKRALKEREEKVRAQRGRTVTEITRSRLGLREEEGEREFR
jgi:hypothetical protein